MTEFGRETSCMSGLQTGRFVTGVRVVAQAAFRRLTTPRGMLRGGEDEDNYGLDLTDLVGSVTAKQDAASLPGRIESELLKDERINSADVDIEVVQEGPFMSFRITVDCTTDEGPFELQIKATELSVDLVGLEVGE